MEGTGTDLRTPFRSAYSRRIQIRRSQKLSPRKRDSLMKHPTLTGKALFHEGTADLCKKTWSVYRCTPLHQFKQDRNSLKHYSRLLSASFVANKHKKMGIGLDEEEAPSTGVFSTADGLALQEDEPDAIKLSVYTKEKKQVSEMYICSVGADFLLDNICESANMICPGTEETIVNRFTVHPLLLCRGNIGPRKTFFEWLKTEFDCSICKMEFNSLSLAWMLTMWSTFVIDKKNPKPTKITWSYPIDDVDLNRIECVFDSESIATLYHGSRQSASDVIELEEVKKFLECIEEHLTQLFRIKFQGLLLQQLHMEIVHLHTDGKIKMFSPEHVHSILSHLTCLSIEKMQWKSPTP